MSYQFQTISFKTFGRGINADSSPNELGEGFSERLTNVDVSGNALMKRRGYEGYAGWLPLRVREAQHTSDGKMKLFFDGSVSFINADSSPIVVYGRLSSGTATSGTPFFTDDANSVHYFNTYVGSVPYTFVAPSGTGSGFNPYPSSDVMLMTQRNTVSATASSSWFLADSYSIDSLTPFDGSITWSGLASSIDVFISSYELTGAAGREIVTTYTAPSSTYTKTIDISTLDNLTPVLQFYYDSAGVWKQFIPESVTIDTDLGEVSVHTDLVSSTDIKVLIYAPTAASVYDATIPSGGGSLTVPSSPEFFAFTCYSNNSMVLPDSVVYDSVTSNTVYTFSSLPANTNVTVAVLATSTQSNFITLSTPGDTSIYSDFTPQLTVWGFNAGDLFDESRPIGAKVMHIDSYRREAEERLMAGINGVLMKAVTYDEAVASHLFGAANIQLDARIFSDQNIGPAFAATGATASRTLGLVRADNIDSTGRALATAVAYTANGQATYQLSFTNKSGTMAACLNANYDYLTVSGFARSVHNGTFKILSFNDALNTVTVQNDKVTSNRYDESGALARAGVFTDRFIVQLPAARFISNDLIYITSNTALTCAGTDYNIVLLKNVAQYYALGASSKVYGRRTSSLLPVSTATNFVNGDMLTVSGILNKPRILYINTNSSMNCTVDGNGTTATITTASDTNFKAGMKLVLLSDANFELNGEYEILSVLTPAQYTISAPWLATAASAKIVGPTLQIDESVQMYDSASPMQLYTSSRWVPLESPTTSDNLPPTTYYQQLPSAGFTEQSTVRSTVIADNMYYANGDDPILKYDGEKVYRAGIQYWPAQLFCNVDTTTPSIPLNSTTAGVTGRGASTFTVALGSQAAFSVGDRIIDTQDSAIYTVVTISTNGADGLVVVDSTISGAGSGNSIQLLNRYKYYFRLNALDANNNVIAGAATGYEDYVVDMSAAGQIKHKMVGFPAFDMYDYDSLDIEVYRTLVGSNGPYYRVGVVDLNFNNAEGYIEFTDATADEFLTTLDPVNTALLGAEIGTTWSQPLRAKYITTMNNKLILMNVKGYPQLDLVLRADNGSGSLATSALNNKYVVLRKDSEDTGITADMVNRAFYEFVTSSSGSVSGITTASTYFEVTTSAAHGLAVKDWVYLCHSAAANDNDLTFAGWYQVAAAPTATTFRVTANNPTTSANDVDTWVKGSAQAYIPVYLGTDGNYAQVGANTLNELTAVQRLANCINATMRATDVTLAGQEDFKPWIAAAAGYTQGPGRIMLRQDYISDTTFSLQLTAAITGASWYVDGTKRAATTEALASTPIYPSRAIVSYENYPEIFDSPDSAVHPITSVIDVNAADGEELTGGLPFFGSSAFSASQQEQMLIIFKQNSIHAVNLSTGAVSKLRSRGLGCTAPFSIATTRDGIMFANASGVYKLDNNLNVVYTGLYITRIYQDEVNSDALSVATATHYAVDSSYKLSVPMNGSTLNNNVLVYNHQQEDEYGMGAWTEYTNHQASGWANQGRDSFFGTTTGSVFKVRNTDTASDFRDDGEAVAEMTIILRAEDFGNAGIRKSIPYVTTHFDMRYTSSIDTDVTVAYDLQTSFEAAGTLDFVKTANTKIKFARASLPRRKSNYLQVKYTNSTKDEAVILAGVDYTVAGLSYLGTTEVAER